MSLLRNCCFTINNYTLEDLIAVSEYENIEYGVVGFELGKNETPHMQGYCEFKRRTRFNTVKNGLGGRAHIEARKGSQEKAISYCKKDDNFVEWGVKKASGARNDLDKIRTLALEGGMREVTAVGNLQQIRVAEKFLAYNEEGRDWKPFVVWLWGPTGLGKSQVAEKLSGEDYFRKNSGTKWWDGYDAHENVIIDDFRDSWWDITYMLGLLDRYSFIVETKGGQRQFKAKQIIITSAKAPDDCYKNTGEAVNQLLRRIDVIEQFVPNVPEVGGVILEAPLPILGDI